VVESLISLSVFGVNARQNLALRLGDVLTVGDLNRIPPNLYGYDHGGVRSARGGVFYCCYATEAVRCCALTYWPLCLSECTL
jgi:hypothetical protein